MTNPTTELLEIAGEPAHIAWQEAIDELKFRVIKQDDDDDTPQHRGGVRPTHAPIVP